MQDVQLCPQLSAPSPLAWQNWTSATTTCRIQEWSRCLLDWRIQTADWKHSGQDSSVFLWAANRTPVDGLCRIVPAALGLWHHRNSPEPGTWTWKNLESLFWLIWSVSFGLRFHPINDVEWRFLQSSLSELSSWAQLMGGANKLWTGVVAPSFWLNLYAGHYVPFQSIHSLRHIWDTCTRQTWVRTSKPGSEPANLGQNQHLVQVGPSRKNRVSHRRTRHCHGPWSTGGRCRVVSIIDLYL